MLLIFVRIKILWISLGFLSMIIMKFHIHGVIVYPCEAVYVYYVINTNHKLSNDIRLVNNNIW